MSIPHEYKDVDKIFILSSHHGRIVCFLNRLASLSAIQPQKIGFNEPKSKMGLKNAAVVKFVYDSDTKTVYARLLYEGVAANASKYNYWTTAQNNIYSFSLNDDNANQLFPDITGKIVFYMMRHGVGVHNKMSALAKVFFPPYDPLLIEDNGLDAAACILERDIVRSISKNIFYLSSPLRRCIETMCLLLVRWTKQSTQQQVQTQQQSKQSKQTLQKVSKTIYIVPCLHEFTSRDKKMDGKCDTQANSLKPKRWRNAQNTSICLLDRSKCTTPQDTFANNNNKKARQILRNIPDTIGIKIDWSKFEMTNCNDTTLFTTFFRHFVIPFVLQ